MRICPYCAEKIKSDALVCRYCGRESPAIDRGSAKPTFRFVFLSATAMSLLLTVIGVLIKLVDISEIIQQIEYGQLPPITFRGAIFESLVFISINYLIFEVIFLLVLYFGVWAINRFLSRRVEKAVTVVTVLTLFLCLAVISLMSILFSNKSSIVTTPTRPIITPTISSRLTPYSVPTRNFGPAIATRGAELEACRQDPNCRLVTVTPPWQEWTPESNSPTWTPSQ